jgi:hypothetical protein
MTLRRAATTPAIATSLLAGRLARPSGATVRTAALGLTSIPLEGTFMRTTLCSIGRSARVLATPGGFDPRRPVQWEVEALEPAELRRLVLAAVDPYVDRDVLARQIAREEEQRRALAAFLNGWNTAGGGAHS